MGLHIFVRTPPRAGSAERLRGKLHIFKELISSLEDVFCAETILLWVRAPVKSLGGQPIELGREAIENLSLELIRSYVKKVKIRGGLFVKVEGALKLGDSEEAPAYARLNLPRSWRDIYGDIEFDVYAAGDVSDLMDLVLRDYRLRRMIVSSLEHLAGLGPARVRDAYLGYGPDCIDDMRLLSVLYHDKGPSLIKDAFSTMRLDEEARGLMRRIVPYNKRFLARAIWNAVEGTKGFADTLERCRVRREDVKSVLLSAEEEGSFRRFYHALLGEFIGPVIKELPSTDVVSRKIREAIIGTLRLNDFL